MAEITKDTLIGELLDKYPQLAPHLNAMGMHCLGCPTARGESLEQACLIHGIRIEELLEKMNAEIGG